MAYLYQYEFDQPHYVVATSYADAEVTIAKHKYAKPKKIQCLGPYVLMSATVLFQQREEMKGEE